MGCLSLEAPSWQWTPPLSAHSKQTANHDAQTWMGWPWSQRGKERRYPELVGRRGRAVVLAVEGPKPRKSGGPKGGAQKGGA